MKEIVVELPKGIELEQSEPTAEKLGRIDICSGVKRHFQDGSGYPYVIPS